MNITTAEKRDFLTWFLQHYRVHIPEVIILLDFLKNNDEVLESAHFVNDITRCERAMIVSTDNLDQEPFLFFKKHLVTTDPQKAFHDIRMHPEQAIYVQVDFPHALTSPEYVGVKEDNPYQMMQTLSNAERSEVNTFISETLRQERIADVTELINQALDEGNLDDFNEWTRVLKELKEISLAK
ncbi:hypothetical protein BFR40_10450 [Brochothrix thermosphacta]|uniref:YpiB family protein n=1 Tax=Brochothrix thermosphacta TaxID=2756 RepID=UPI00083FA700|nr:YpiB family protein [Brochothrix thermosphacta]ODJ49924.1 hypothetical protein BFR40_10450 [Brochothrix thermosphacta]